MSPIQNLWLTVFNFGPALFLGIYKEWWVGLIALAATAIISWVLVLVVTANISSKAMPVWAWLKPPIVATIVVGTCLSFL